jgi:hypothetical protein
LCLSLTRAAQTATTWTVCVSGCDYASIKSAIAAPTTLDGDTLAIAVGAYTKGDITVMKSLTLQGEDAATTLVQAAETPNTAPSRAFTIPRGVSVTLQALTIRYGKTASYKPGGGLSNDGTLTLIYSIIHGNREAASAAASITVAHSPSSTAPSTAIRLPTAAASSTTSRAR